MIKFLKMLAPWLPKGAGYLGTAWTAVSTAHGIIVKGPRAIRGVAAGLDGLVDEYADAIKELRDALGRAVGTVRGNGPAGERRQLDTASRQAIKDAKKHERHFRRLADKLRAQAERERRRAQRPRRLPGRRLQRRAQLRAEEAARRVPELEERAADADAWAERAKEVAQLIEEAARKAGDGLESPDRMDAAVTPAPLDP